MSKIIIYSRSKTGHFQNYSKILSNTSKKAIFVTYDFFEYFKTAKFNQIEKIIFLHGERDWVLSILSRMIKRKTNIVLIFYYGLLRQNGIRHIFFQKIILKILNFLNIKVAQLEFFPSNFDNEVKEFIVPLNDPPLLDYSKSSVNQFNIINDEIKILLPGYIDQRKCVKEITESVSSIAKKHNNLKFNLRIVGKQVKSVSAMLKKDLDFPKNLVLYQLNERLSDKQLENEFLQSDLVLAIYKNHLGSSGIVINAIAFNKKVVFLDYGTLKEFRLELGIKGRLISTESESIRVAIENAIFGQQFNYSLTNREKFLSKRTKKLFANTLIDL